jgi:hypothetical protein
METKRARKWYLWLWLSPLLTVPTLLLLCGIGLALSWAFAVPSRPIGGAAIHNSIVERAAILVAVLVSALWHLVLLVPARDKECAFVRWHGRQALLLAGLRTAIPLALGLLIGGYGALLSIPILIAIWFGGTLWGQREAARGACSLMRWAGHEALLAELQSYEEQFPVREDALVEIVRSSRDPEERHKAIEELSRRGMVERL